MEKRKKKSGLWFWVATVVLVLVIAFSITATVMGMQDTTRMEQELYFQEMEKALVQEIRDCLQAEGFRNSGVNLTRVAEEDGSREYRIAIHHSRINELPREDQQQLMEKLEEMVFTEEQCTFCYNFF